MLVDMDTLGDHEVDLLIGYGAARLKHLSYSLKSNSLGIVDLNLLEQGDELAAGRVIGTIANNGGPLLLAEERGVRSLDITSRFDLELIEGGRAVLLDPSDDCSITSVRGTAYIREYQ